MPDILRAFDGKLHLMVETHPVNQGLGVPLRDGLKPASAVSSAQDQDIVVTMDADDSHSPALIPGMIQISGRGAIS